MSPEILSALLLFAFATSVTPGPNNLMLMASGANYGFRRTVPHMLGISLGHLFMVVVLGLGLAQVFTTWPVAHAMLKVLSVAYMLYLAWRIATAAPPGEARATGRPFTFLEAAAFQWVNPKAWAMALTAISVYAPGRRWPPS
jgi:threonine/homoserine/homoserine lactone efflux protein